LGVIALAIALTTVLGVESVPAGRKDERRVALYNIHTKETLDLVYMRDGKRLPEALKQINWFLRDWRENEPTLMDPELIDLLWELRTELGTQVPTHVISGYRSSKTNNMLRKTRGGQAKKSQHILGKAMDIQFPDVPLKRLRYSALIRERGGVGYYPTSAIPFVHIDTGRTRHWPRMPRYELALLFPDGHSRHVPADGHPLTKKDVKTARAKHKELAVQIAQFHEFRSKPNAPKPTLLASGWSTNIHPSPVERPKLPALTRPIQPELRVASLAPVAPPAPQPVTRAVERSTQPASDDRRELANLFALASLGGPIEARKRQARRNVAEEANLGAIRNSEQRRETALAETRTNMDPEDSSESRLGVRGRPASIRQLLDETELAGWSNGFIAAPAYDEEHPDELYYRPFALAPLMTSSASADDPALIRMQHPDVLATLDLLDEESVTLPMRFAAAPRVAEQMWTQQFTGRAVNPEALSVAADAEESDLSGLARRSVRTSMR
jgi:uncharacterized protein YcbK (DUF882 family)